MGADKKVKRVALGGILSALSVAVLFLGSLLPSYAIPTAAIAGLIPAAAVIQSGLGLGAAVYVVSGLLSLLLLPQKTAALWYVVFFGYYGVVKSVLERLPRRWLEWVLKCACYTASFLVLYFLLKEAFVSLTDLIPLGILPVYGIGLLCFVLYDIGFSRLIGLYLRRIRRNFGGSKHRD